jgi:methyl-galactoside transport system substrate-binding protein
MKKILMALVALAIVFSVTGCSKTPAKPKIGVAIYKFDDTFMSYVRNKIEAAAKDKIEISVQDSQYDQPKQNDQVDQFLTQGSTALAINLVDPSAVSVILDKAKAKKVPLVLFNREPDAADMAKWDKVYYVGAKAQQSGTMEGEIVAEYWKAHPEADLNKDGKIQYVMLMGDPSNTDAKFRTEFSIKALEDAGIQVEKLAEDTAMWDRVKAQEKMAAFLTANKGKIEVVFANNDDMALGAIEALKAAGYFKGGKFMPVVGVDATPPALDALEQGTLLGTVLNDAEKQGQATYDLAYALATGAKEIKSDVAPLAKADGTVDPAGKYIWVPYVKVTKDNFKDFKK